MTRLPMWLITKLASKMENDILPFIARNSGQQYERGAQSQNSAPQPRVSLFLLQSFVDSIASYLGPFQISAPAELAMTIIMVLDVKDNHLW